MKLKIKASPIDNDAKDTDEYSDDCWAALDFLKKLCRQADSFGWHIDYPDDEENENEHSILLSASGLGSRAHFQVIVEFLNGEFSYFDLIYIRNNCYYSSEDYSSQLTPKNSLEKYDKDVLRILDKGWTFENLLEHSKELIAIFKKIQEYR